MRECVPNPLGTPEQCAYARSLITPELEQQAAQIRRGQWDFHPDAKLPEGLCLASYPDGIWIVSMADTCDLNRAPRWARVADSWPVYLNYGGIGFLSNEHFDLPIPANGKREPLRLVAPLSRACVATVAAPPGGWDHRRLADALSELRDIVQATGAVDAFLGAQRIGSTEV